MMGWPAPARPAVSRAIAQAALELFSDARLPAHADGRRREASRRVAGLALRLRREQGGAVRARRCLRAFGARPRSDRAAAPLARAARAGAAGARAPAASRLADARLGEPPARAAAADVAAELAACWASSTTGSPRMRRRSACSSARRPTAPSSPTSTSAGCGRRSSRACAATSRGAARGRLASVPDAAIAARLAIETTAWFAWHRLGDPFPSPWMTRSRARP